MDKLHEESRKQFEDWFTEFAGHTKQWIVARRKIQGDGYVSGPGINAFWMAWQASRASIVVDTPPLCGDGENDTEYTEGYNDGITATEKTIRSIGLSIKGE
ncbi:hypothetical protein [Serratia proteamaculans]|uniref:hypothetical protein n=1 Tax=Serratia proteamaculans TaxID=28151 RepID=UPI00217842F5|nr:hypothetical protein [Serratia proteamaculans]CAI1181234.1 Uncharacterised protein [Serratia proteamaculans]